MSRGAGLLLALSMLAVPLAGWLLSRLLVRGGFRVAEVAGQHAMERWNGRHFAFDDFQVRVMEEDDRCWFVAADVARALRWRGLPQRFAATYAGRLRRVGPDGLEALDIDGLEVLLARRREHDARRFLLWARREVCEPHRRRRAEAQRDSRALPPAS